MMRPVTLNNLNTLILTVVNIVIKVMAKIQGMVMVYDHNVPHSYY